MMTRNPASVISSISRSWKGSRPIDRDATGSAITFSVIMALISRWFSFNADATLRV
jgi:hypothetical protein